MSWRGLFRQGTSPNYRRAGVAQRHHYAGWPLHSESPDKDKEANWLPAPKLKKAE
jgi:hypothetical protein